MERRSRLSCYHGSKISGSPRTVHNENAVVVQERLLKIQKFCYYGNMTSHYPYYRTVGKCESHFGHTVRKLESFFNFNSK